MRTYVPVRGSKTRFFWIFALKVLRVWRMEWLRVFPKPVFLPVFTHMRAMMVDRKCQAADNAIRHGSAAILQVLEPIVNRSHARF